MFFFVKCCIECFYGGNLPRFHVCCSFAVSRIFNADIYFGCEFHAMFRIFEMRFGHGIKVPKPRDISMSLLNVCNRCRNTCLAVQRMKNLLGKWLNGTTPKTTTTSIAVSLNYKGSRRQEHRLQKTPNE